MDAWNRNDHEMMVSRWVPHIALFGDCHLRATDFDAHRSIGRNGGRLKSCLLPPVGRCALIKATDADAVLTQQSRNPLLNPALLVDCRRPATDRSAGMVDGRNLACFLPSSSV
jgi:hypothetical protein